MKLGKGFGTCYGHDSKRLNGCEKETSHPCIFHNQKMTTVEINEK